MARRPKSESEEQPEEPVLRTPPGAEPRTLRAGSFESRDNLQRRSFAPLAPDAPAKIEPLARLVGPAEPREWDFALPENRAVEPEKDSGLLQTDANRRAGTVIRSPLETVTNGERGKFSENWERLASEPPLRRRPRPPGRAWYRTPEGRINFRLFTMPAIVLALGIATLIVARIVLAPAPQPLPPPAPEEIKNQAPR